MGDAGEGLIDAEARIQERMEDLARARTISRSPRASDVDPEQAREIESLRLARLELEGQLAATAHERRRAQIGQALEELGRRVNALKEMSAVAR